MATCQLGASTVTSRNTPGHIRSTRRAGLTTQEHRARSSAPVSPGSVRGSNPLSSTFWTPKVSLSNLRHHPRIEGLGDGGDSSMADPLPDWALLDAVLMTHKYRNRSFVKYFRDRVLRLFGLEERDRLRPSVRWLECGLFRDWLLSVRRDQSPGQTRRGRRERDDGLNQLISLSRKGSEPHGHSSGQTRAGDLALNSQVVDATSGQASFERVDCGRR